MIRQAYGKEILSRTRVFEWHSWFGGDRKKARQMKNEIKSMLIIFFNNKVIIHEEFVLAGQRLNFLYYCDVLRRLPENVRRLRPELCRQKN
jgi:hypothetical protein